MKKTPYCTDEKILSLWQDRNKLMRKVTAIDDAIHALQALCPHELEEDVSYHGSPDYECPMCGKGKLK